MKSFLWSYDLDNKNILSELVKEHKKLHNH